MANMRKYKDAKWEWHLAHEIFDAYNKERAFKDSLCATENTADETTDSFLTVISIEMEMAQNKLKVFIHFFFFFCQTRLNNNKKCILLYC